MGLEYKLLENLKFIGLASYNFNNNDTQTTREEDTYGAFKDRLSIHRTHNGNLYGSILENKSRRTGYLLRGHLSYVGEYGEGHTLNVVGGAELRGNDSHTLFNKRFNYDPRTGNTALPPIEKTLGEHVAGDRASDGRVFHQVPLCVVLPFGRLFVPGPLYSERHRARRRQLPISARMRSSIRTGVWAEPGF